MRETIFKKIIGLFVFALLHVIWFFALMVFWMFDKNK